MNTNEYVHTATPIALSVNLSGILPRILLTLNVLRLRYKKCDKARDQEYRKRRDFLYVYFPRKVARSLRRYGRSIDSDASIISDKSNIFARQCDLAEKTD